MTAVVTDGRCRNAACSIASAGKIVERYPGPGEYCPECGEVLDPIPASLSPQAYREFQDRMLEVLAPPAQRPSRRRRLLLGALAVMLIAAGTYAALRPMAILGRTGPGSIRICRSTMTERLAADVVHAYAAKSGMPASRFDVAGSLGCDVRFAAGSARRGDRVVAHDGIVVVVNRENPVTELTADQLRAILTGAVTDWSELGGPPGTIVSMAPTDGSDEAETIIAKLLHGAKLGGAVRRSSTSVEIARVVASPNGRRRIGIVAFSAAKPAKMIAIKSMPAPSSASIAEHRYPFALTVTVRSESATRDPVAFGLLRYLGSRAGRELVVREGLIASADRSERGGTR